MPLIGLLVIGLGILNIVSPQKVWRVTEAWKYKNPEALEPSAVAYVLHRIVGAVMVIVGLRVMSLP